MQIRYCKTKKQKKDVEELQKIVFCKDERVGVNQENSHWWVMYDDLDKPVAFAGLKDIAGNIFLCLSGVSYDSRGKGLQRPLIRVREHWAKRHGYKTVFTYTILANPASSNNLIKCGYKLYEPEYAWKSRYVLYWKKELDNV